MNDAKRVKWLGMLAKLVTPGDPAKAFAAMEAYLPFLAEMPDEAFTAPSLEAVAMSPRRLHIPDLSEVKGPLQAWWREHKPVRAALPAPTFRVVERAEPTKEERAAVARTVQQAIGAMRGGNSGAKPPVRTVEEQLDALRNERVGGAGVRIHDTHAVSSPLEGPPEAAAGEAGRVGAGEGEKPLAGVV